MATVQHMLRTKNIHLELGRTILDTTITGLEAGLRVHHIATFDLKTCRGRDSVSEVLNNKETLEFDRFPVREDGRIIGVLERTATQKSLAQDVRECMRPLDETMLISADEPLTRFVRIATKSEYRLVLRGAEIQGLVTRSDFLKLPVRLLGFALVMYLEMVMAELIRSRFQNESDWFKLLPGECRERLRKLESGLALQNLKLPLLELTQFSDKKLILAKAFPRLGSNLARDLFRIEKMRNVLVHGRDYAPDQNGLRSFVEELFLAKHLSNRLEQVLARSARK